MSEEFWYLATPYSKYPAGREAAYWAACKQTALLMKAKVPVFCPVVHTHGVGETDILCDTPETWMAADRPFMAAAKGLIVCKMDSWDESVGITAEMEAFVVAGKPVIAMEPGTVPWQLRAKGHEEAAAFDVCRPQPSSGTHYGRGPAMVALGGGEPYEGCPVHPGISLKAGALNTAGCDGEPQYQLSGEPERPQEDSAQRKATPICTGVLDFFPDALAAVARVSRAGNDKHTPGQPLHWSRGTSSDHADCILRHMADRGKLDTDGELHDAKVAWRALAQLQLAEEKRRG